MPFTKSTARRVYLTPNALGIVLVVLFSSIVNAEVPKPVIPPASGKQCVEDSNTMRRNHMDFLMHQRDATLREGIRGKKHSLNRCLTCHAVKGADNKPVTIASEKHFCNQCHQYAAVRIDCFDCHESTPGEEIKTGSKSL